MIWVNKDSTGLKNQYVCFRQEICLKPFQKGELHIACDSNYCLWINGELAGCGQLPSYPDVRYYDTYSIKEQRLIVCILCRYYGENNFSYLKGEPFVHYEIVTDTQTVDDSNTYWKQASGYQSGECYKITSQIGYGFVYDRTKEEDWCAVDYRMDSTWSKAVTVERNTQLLPRPIKKMVTDTLMKAKLIDAEKRIYEFEKEYVGYLTIKLTCEDSAQIKICYEESMDALLLENRPKRLKFYFYYTTIVGEQEFTNYFLRIAAKCIRIEAEESVNIEYVGISPCYYPLTIKKAPEYLKERERQIYDVGMNTLRNCMHDFYEDCPLREQALYAMDVRNQALCTYAAFDNPEFALYSLKLLAASLRKDGLLGLTAPAKEDMITIPSFTFIWVMSVYEYMLHTGDMDGTRELFAVVEKIFDRLEENEKNGLFIVRNGKNIWHFHDWAEGLDGYLWEDGKELGIEPNDPTKYDAILNLFYVLGLEAYQKLADRLNIGMNIAERIRILKKTIHETFLEQETGIYYSFCKDGYRYHKAELTQALAILCGIADDRTKEILLGDNQLTKLTLSYMIFKLSVMSDKKQIRKEIERVWGPMLDQGATCFWETQRGSKTLENYDSLCHGWSSIPVYFYHMMQEQD